MNENHFVDSLMRWDRYENDRKLIWRGEREPYKVWLREVILQQTRVDQGAGYYERILERFPDVASLAKADEEEVFKLWEGLGYYNRCRNLLEAARVVAVKYGGIFPDRYEDLLQLMGIGPYTAAAIASFSFNQVHAVVDGNVKRVLSRYFGIEEPIDSVAGKKILDLKAQSLIDAHDPARYNQAIIDFGATICVPHSPDCASCPMNEYCVAYQLGKVDQLPVKSKRIKVRKRFFNYLVVHFEEQLLIKQRKGNDIWNQLYEFPCIETDHLLKESEILALPQMRSDMELVLISDVGRQRLTHQLIHAQFIHLRIGSKEQIIPDAEFMEIPEVRKRAFPKMIKDYLSRLPQITAEKDNPDNR